MTEQLPGMSSHQSARSGTDEWLTPPHVLDALGPFDLDPCAPVTRPWPTAAQHYTEYDNGLMKPWQGRVWLNPPYSLIIRKWMARMAAHGWGTALIFARTETQHFFNSVWDHAAALLFLKDRLKFHYVDGRRGQYDGGAPSVLIAYGQDDAARLHSSGLVGKFVPLQIPRLIAVALAGVSETWGQVVSAAMKGRGPVKLDDLYGAIEVHPKTKANRHWRAKVRQVLQRGDFHRCGNGVWEEA